MRVYISADIEGITGVTEWCETLVGQQGYAEAAAQMTREVAAACEGAVAAGASEIVVKDAHETALNLDPMKLPKEAKVIRGWMNSPDAMMAGLDESFSAALCIGYHSGAYTAGNPLAHTINHETVNAVKINGELASEFRLNAYTAKQYGVPILFLSGDAEICGEAEVIAPGIRTVATKDCVGEATTNLHPDVACEQIRQGVKEALEAARENGSCACGQIEMPAALNLEISFVQHWRAARATWYPGATRVDAMTVGYRAKDITDMLIARMFML